VLAVVGALKQRGNDGRHKKLRGRRRKTNQSMEPSFRRPGMVAHCRRKKPESSAGILGWVCYRAHAHTHALLPLGRLPAAFARQSIVRALTNERAHGCPKPKSIGILKASGQR